MTPSTPGSMMTSNNTCNGSNIKEILSYTNTVQPTNKMITNKNNKFLPPKNRINLEEKNLDVSWGNEFTLFISFFLSNRPPQCFNNI